MLEIFNIPHLDEAFASVWADVNLPSFWVGVLQVIWIDVLLAGDNAVVIALACRRLPRRSRLWGMVLGAGVAVLLRITFTLAVSILMTLPYLKIAGGLALFYVAVKLLEPEGEAGGAEIKSGERLWQAVRIIALADIIMSLDNVIAIAGASKGHALLFIVGLMASVPLVVAGAGAIMSLLARFPALVWAGGALLGWVAGQVIATDPAVSGYLTRSYGPTFAYGVEHAAAAVGALSILAKAWMMRPSGDSEPA